MTRGQIRAAVSLLWTADVLLSCLVLVEWGWGAVAVLELTAFLSMVAGGVIMLGVAKDQL